MRARLVFPVQSQTHFFLQGGTLSKIYWNFGIFIYIYIYYYYYYYYLYGSQGDLPRLKKFQNHFFILEFYWNFLAHFGIFLSNPAKHHQRLAKKSHTRHLFEMSSCGILMSVGRAILESRYIAFHDVVELTEWS